MVPESCCDDVESRGGKAEQCFQALVDAEEEKGLVGSRASLSSPSAEGSITHHYVQVDV